MATRWGSRPFQPSSARRTFWAAVAAVKGGRGGRGVSAAGWLGSLEVMGEVCFAKHRSILGRWSGSPHKWASR
jgi:hypothetical protein